MSGRLTVVVPVHDEAGHLDATVAALAEAVERSPFDADLLVVDDGSTDGSGEVALAAAAGRVRPASGGSRTAAASGPASPGWRTPRARLVLLLDARVRLQPDALAFVAERVDAESACGTATSRWTSAATPSARSGTSRRSRGATTSASRGRRATARRSSTRYPKGTTCFLAPRALLEAFGAFSTRYTDLRHANDDTTVLRALVARERIHLSPSFGCTYAPRLARAVPPALAPPRGGLPRRARAARVAVLPRRRRLLPAQRATRGGGAAATRIRASCRACDGRRCGHLAAASGRSQFEAVSFGALAPVYGVTRAGMWQGAALRSVASSELVRRDPRRLRNDGELIKLAPVLLRLDARGHRYVLATTGQQVQQIPIFLDGFGLRQPDLWLGRGAGGFDLRTNRDIPGWLARVLATFARRRASLRRSATGQAGRWCSSTATR